MVYDLNMIGLSYPEQVCLMRPRLESYNNGRCISWNLASLNIFVHEYCKHWTGKQKNFAVHDLFQHKSNSGQFFCSTP